MFVSTFNISTGVRRILATSTATFPCPMITAVDPLKSNFRSAFHGNPLYHPTILLADTTLSKSSPGMFRLRSCSAPYVCAEVSLGYIHKLINIYSFIITIIIYKQYIIKYTVLVLSIQ